VFELERYIIDHFEENYAVCEDEKGNIIDIEKAKIPKKAQEGDVLITSNGKLKVDKKATNKLREEIEKLMEDVFED
jgi:hypothetical protein